MASNILVIGATGNVGREVLRLLSAEDYSVSAAVRNPVNAQKEFASNVRCVLFDFTNPNTFADAFTGIKKLFLVRPPATCSRQRFAIADIDRITPTLNAAKKAGVEEIVFLSIIGADRNRIVPHYAIERAILHKESNFQGKGHTNGNSIKDLAREFNNANCNRF